jgi:hypothetical protein
MKEYSMRAGKGQTLTIQVMSRRINWLVVRLYPASQPEGDHDLLNSDNTNQSKWKGPLPADGEYVLRLFIRRGAAAASITACDWRFFLTWPLKVSTPL